MDVGSRVVWNHSRLGSDDEGWSGPGFARIVQYELDRPGFGAQSKSNPQARGMGVLIQLEHNEIRQWVRLFELEEAEEA